jgi:DNA transformation protein and related proteins
VSQFAESLPELLAPFGPVSLRKMFGGYGVYYQGRMFGLIADDELYLKADAQALPLYERAGCRQFVYARKGGRRIGMSYYSAPSELFDDEQALMYWCAIAYEAAMRSGAQRS